jgi:hypothetical protein
MIGLIIRALVLAAVVFGVVFALTKRFRTKVDERVIKQIQDDILALKTGIEEGLYSQEEYDNLREKIRVDCEKTGFEIPNLPTRVPKRQTETEGDA